MEHIVITKLKRDPRLEREAREKARSDFADIFLEKLVLWGTAATGFHALYAENYWILSACILWLVKIEISSRLRHESDLVKADYP